MKRFKMNIFRRTLLLSLSTVLISFLALGITSFFYIRGLFHKSMSNGKEAGKLMSEFTEDFAVKQAKQRLSSLVFERSRRIEQGMNELKKDTESIALQMRQILSNPDKYKELYIPNVKEETIYSGNPYVYYPLEVEEKGISDELRREAALSANIVDFLTLTSLRFVGHQSTTYICSKNGFLILVETSINSSDTITFTQDYEPRKRPWYVEAEKANKTIFTDFYTSMQGYPAVSCATPYYDSEGNLAGVAAVDANIESLYELITEDRIGDTTINFTLNNKGEVILSSTKTGTFAVSKNPKDLRQDTESGFAKVATDMAAGKSSVELLKVDGKEYYLAYSPMHSLGWSFGSLIERDEVIRPVNMAKVITKELANTITVSIQSLFFQHLRHIIITIVIIMLWLFWVSVKDSKKFVTPIVKLTNGVKEIAKGDLDKKLDIKTGDEIEVLADNVNNMTSELKLYMENLSKITAEKERIATELSVAKNIQAGMLPSVEPKFADKKEFDLAATMIPAKEVGGDFYDFYMLDENRLVVTVADVSGKGVGAALFMVISKTLLKDLTMIYSSAYSGGKEPNLSAIMEWANKQLYDNNEQKMFVTVFFGILNLKTGEFVYVNAGHNPPLVCYHKDGEFSYVRNEKRNPIIGVSKKIKYREYRLTLTPGDKLFFYTDGVTEAMNSQRELYNETRLKTALDKVSSESSASKMLSTVYEDVKLHVGDAEQSDDMTMLGLVYKQKKVED
jgi:sigma-B regulation protein RsbU (phosphoserine phosphatase)